MPKQIEKYQLHAYVDGQLSREESIEIELEMENNPQLLEEIEALRNLKAQLNDAYENAPRSEQVVLKEEKKRGWKIPQGIAASLIMGMFLGAGLLHFSSPNAIQNTVQQAQVKQSHYLVHLDSQLPEKQLEALEKVESLLASGGDSVKLDFISNYKGVTLFDVKNDNSEALEALMQKYQNLTLYACKRALERAQQRGETLTLLPQVKHEQPAIDAVAERLVSGWTYIKI